MTEADVNQMVETRTAVVEALSATIADEIEVNIQASKRGPKGRIWARINDRMHLITIEEVD